MTTEHFILKDDGKLYHVTMPPEPEHPNTSDFAEYVSYNEAVTAWKEANDKALQLAIDNAVEVSNQEELEKELCDRIRVLLTNHPYSLQCSVSVLPDSITSKPLALVTFPSTPAMEPEAARTHAELRKINASLQQENERLKVALRACEITLGAFLPDAWATRKIVEEALSGSPTEENNEKK